MLRLQKGQHLKKRCKLWAPTWQKEVGSAPEASSDHNWLMIRTSLTTIALIAGAIPVSAAGEVDPEIHQLCLQAADYRGCVEAQAGTPDYLGNKCPENHAYVGEGKCQRVYCDWVGLGGGHHEPLVAGKSSWRCGNNYNFWKDELQVGILRLGATVKVEQTSDCPSIAPQEGWNSSCEHAEDNWRAIEAETKRPKCSKKLVPFECDWNAYLEANPGMKAWAESNPEAAQKQRVKLEADPLKK